MRKMTTLQRRKHSWFQIGLFQLASVFVHLALVITLVLPFAASLSKSTPPIQPPKPNPNFKLSVVEIPPEPKDKVVFPPTPTPKLVPEKIVQKTNEEQPDVAKVVSKLANKVEKEERAELTQENPIERQENPTTPSEERDPTNAASEVDYLFELSILHSAIELASFRAQSYLHNNENSA